MSRPRRSDVLVAAALTLLVEWEVLFTDVDHKPAAAAAALLVTLPLALCRTATLAAVAANAAGLVLLRHLGLGQEPQTVLLAMLVAAFAAGAYLDRPRSIHAGLVVWAGILLQEPGDFIVLGPMTGGAWALGAVLRSHRHQAARLRELTDVLERERADHARLAIAGERARIGRELHDVVAHSVSVMVVQAGAERLALGDERPETRQALSAIERTGRQALTEMRRLVGMLRLSDDEPELAPPPSLDHLGALAEHVGQAGLPVEVRVEGERMELAPGLDVTAYRIVQEALTNALKHADASRAQVLVRFGAATLELEVTDDGAGAAPGGGSLNGHGQAGMRERAALYGGSVEAGPLSAGGYRVRATLPLEPVAR